MKRTFSLPVRPNQERGTRAIAAPRRVLHPRSRPLWVRQGTILSWPPEAVCFVLAGGRIDNPKPGARLVHVLLPFALHDEPFYFISGRRKATGT
jgi:hypothetical protein